MKKKSRKKKAIATAKAKSAEIRPDPPTQDNDSGMDFGGLPARDLKKNLGCG